MTRLKKSLRNEKPIAMTDFNTQSIYSVFADTAERRGDHTAVIYLGHGFPTAG